MNQKYNKKLQPNAQTLRRNMTPEERHLWYDFLRDYPAHFRRQRVIESFVADFYCSAALLVIEIDGGQHFTEQGLAYDRERSAIFASYGIEVLRFTNNDVDTRFEAVCTMIMHVTEARISELFAERPPQSVERPPQSAEADSSPQGGA